MTFKSSLKHFHLTHTNMHQLVLLTYKLMKVQFFYLLILLFLKEGVPPMDFKQRSEQDLDKDAIEGFKSATYTREYILLEFFVLCFKHSHK